MKTVLLLTMFASGKWAGAAPTLTAPAASAVLDDTTPDFTWSAVSGAVTYDIEIRATLTGTPTATGIATNAYTPGVALDAGATYSWRVRAVNAGGQAGAWSAARTFTLYAVYDTFTAANGTNLNGRTPDVAPVSKTWSVLSGTYEIQANQVNATGVDVATIDSGLADCVIDCDVIAGAATGANISQILVRSTNASNGWIISLESLTTFRLYEMIAANPVSRASAAFAHVAGTSYAVHIILSGQTITATVNGANQISYSSAAFNETVTKHGLRAAQTGTVTTRTKYDNFRAAP